MRLRIIGGYFEIDDFVPANRSECPKSGPCPHVKCEHHLWPIESSDQPGRPRTGTSTRFGSEERPIELQPIWFTWPLPPSCTLNAIEAAKREAWTLEMMAPAFGLTRRGLKYVLEKALVKTKRAGASLAEFADSGAPGHGRLVSDE